MSILIDRVSDDGASEDYASDDFTSKLTDVSITSSDSSKWVRRPSETIQTKNLLVLFAKVQNQNFASTAACVYLMAALSNQFFALEIVLSSNPLGPNHILTSRGLFEFYPTSPILPLSPLLISLSFLTHNVFVFGIICLKFTTHSVNFAMPMAKTKQTAKKSHGGLVPHVNLHGGAISMPGTEEMEVCPEFQHNEYCIVCQDGSIEEHQLLLQQCHVQIQQGNHTYSPYMGFYHNDKPILTDFLCINATLEVSLESQLSSTLALFVHLMLVDNDARVGTFELGYQFLHLYFPHGGIVFKEIQFNIDTDSKIDKYESMVGEIMCSLTAEHHWMHIVLGISNHTDNNNGDPFIGYPAKKKTYIAAQIDNFLDIILMPWKPLITHVPESYLWMFSCGSLINNAESFLYLQLSVLWHHISATVCFNAVHFQPSTALHLLLAFTELVLVKQLPIHTAFPNILGQSYKLGWHSDIFLILRKDATFLDITKFLWTHSSHHPCYDLDWSSLL
ncbi:hypothetical protein EV424DRAFT_1344437 [Suillus variegatus]|nr:hypothetical protein EV424DRAFT_1344437 [Suillus variegatus]